MYTTTTKSVNQQVVELYRDTKAAAAARVDLAEIEATIADLERRRTILARALDELCATTDVVDGVALSVKAHSTNPAAPVSVYEVGLARHSRTATAYRHVRTGRWMVSVTGPGLVPGGEVLEEDHATVVEAIEVAKAFVATGAR